MELDALTCFVAISGEKIHFRTFTATSSNLSVVNTIYMLVSYQEFFLPILLHISNVYFSGTKVTDHSWELCKKNVYSLEHLDWLKIPGLKSFCKPYSKKCRFIIWRLYQFNSTKNFKRCFCQKNIFF